MSSLPSKTKILMVCLGNICRSPLAHGILKSKLPESKFYIDSAGTASYHLGKKPDYRSIAVAKSKGINISNQKARQFSETDFNDFDFIYVMDESNYQNVIALTQDEAKRKKVKLILQENPSIQNKSVPDPYWGDTTDFDYVYRILDETCDIIARKLLQ